MERIWSSLSFCSVFSFLTLQIRYNLRFLLLHLKSSIDIPHLNGANATIALFIFYCLAHKENSRTGPPVM
jgi:hypothetical protein